MTFTLNPEIERCLLARANALGISLEEYLEELLVLLGHKTRRLTRRQSAKRAVRELPQQEARQNNA